MNTVAIAARHLRQRRGCGRVVVLAWGAHPPAGLAECLADDPDCVVVSVHPASHAVPADPVPGIAASIALAPGSGAAALETATRTVLDPAGPADFLLVSAGFEILTGDQADGLQVGPDDVHALTLTLIAEAGRLARGRIVSVLEGGYAAAPLGRAVVQHLRALAGLQPA